MIFPVNSHDMFIALLWIFGTVFILLVITLAVVIAGILKESEEEGTDEYY